MKDSGLGVLSFKHKSITGKFTYKFRVSNYHAAKILEYIAQIPHEPVKRGRPPKESNEV